MKNYCSLTKFLKEMVKSQLLNHTNLAFDKMVDLNV